jgi:hypothetical protein
MSNPRTAATAATPAAQTPTAKTGHHSQILGKARSTLGKMAKKPLRENFEPATLDINNDVIRLQVLAGINNNQDKY